MTLNQNSWYGQSMLGKIVWKTTWRTFVVSWTVNLNAFSQLFKPLNWVVRVHTTVTSALAQCTAWFWDYIYLANDFTSVLTAAELLAAETKGVTILPLGQKDDIWYFVDRATAALPATTAEALFTVTGRIKLLDIQWIVTTVIETQANNTKLVANPTVGADVDMCAVLDITAWAVWSRFSITWTLATALQKTVSWTWTYQATPLVIEAWTIDLNCAATNTWSVKWKIHYIPLQQGARVFSA